MHPSYVDEDIRVSSTDVLNDEGEGSQSYKPLVLLLSGRHVDFYVDGQGLPRDVQK